MALFFDLFRGICDGPIRIVNDLEYISVWNIWGSIEERFIKKIHVSIYRLNEWFSPAEINTFSHAVGIGEKASERRAGRGQKVIPAITVRPLGNRRGKESQLQRVASSRLLLNRKIQRPGENTNDPRIIPFRRYKIVDIPQWTNRIPKRQISNSTLRMPTAAFRYNDRSEYNIL